MHLACSIYTLEQLNNLKDNLEYAILMQEHTSLNYKDLDLDLALKICRENNILTIIGMDKLFTPTDIDMVSNFLDKYQNLCDYFYITDLGVCNLAIKKQIQNKVIFDPKTMVCNSLDLKIYSDLGFKAIGLSSEITIKDVKDIYLKTNSNIFYQIFGYRLMFYSKRHLISLYEKKNNDKYPKSDCYLREATRNDYFPIFENKNGVCIYRSYIISLIEQIKEIKELEFGFLESYLIPDSKMNIVLDTFKKLMNEEIDISRARLNMLELDFKIEDGFIYKDSVYEKKELKL